MPPISTSLLATVSETLLLSKALRKLTSALLLLTLVSTCVRAQGLNLHERTLASLPAYEAFLSIPNDARKDGQLEPNLAWLEREFAARGFSGQRLPNAGLDLVLFTFPAEDEAAETVLFYGHVDGQSVDPAKWALAPPFEPTYGTMAVNEAGEVTYAAAKLPTDPATSDVRLFARSASDAKAPIMMFLIAWDHLVASGKRPNYTVKFVADSMEEAQAPDLEGMVETHRDRLAADHLIILDGPVHASNRPTLMGGARGIATARLTVYGPRLALHSGHYGNYAPNPALGLAKLLGGMKDATGRVTIPGYYDGIELSPAAKEMMAAVPDDTTTLHPKLGFTGHDGVGGNLQEALQYPSLNVRGMSSGWVGAAARTIIPATAVANLDLRLVTESDGDRLLGLVEKYVRDQGYFLIEDGREPTDAERANHPRLASFAGRTSYAAFRTDLNGPTGTWLQRALGDTFGAAPVLIRTMGGSVPIAPFVTTLDVPAVVLPLVNPDNNQHAPNENILLRNYFRGVESLLGVLGTNL